MRKLRYIEITSQGPKTGKWQRRDVNPCLPLGAEEGEGAREWMWEAAVFLEEMALELSLKDEEGVTRQADRSQSRQVTMSRDRKRCSSREELLRVESAPQSLILLPQFLPLIHVKVKAPCKAAFETASFQISHMKLFYVYAITTFALNSFK